MLGDDDLSQMDYIVWRNAQRRKWARWFAIAGAGAACFIAGLLF